MNASVNFASVFVLVFFCFLSSNVCSLTPPGNLWYGFACETLDQELGSFEARCHGNGHAHVSVRSIAFCAWEDVGIAARASEASTIHIAAAKEQMDFLSIEDGMFGYLTQIYQQQKTRQRSL